MDSASFLEKIVAEKKKKIAARRLFLENIRRNTETAELSYYGLFKSRLQGQDGIRLIAEIKRASPSQGVIREEFGVSQLARIYRESGAAALSVLTEQTFFLGRPDYIRLAAEFGLPVLAKDFFIDPLQIYEVYSYGAKAILLIAAVLTDEQINVFRGIARRLDMDCLVEVHTQQELDRVLNCGVDMIGVNNRDLRTFEIDFDAGERLLRQIPKECVRVIESGIRSHDDVLRFQDAGAQAVLIGETFMRAADVGARVKEIMGELS
ncbi:MAG: indole-3-glycerol phosphate synthase TrpC [Candidatus Omnitrophota bacterium]